MYAVVETGGKQYKVAVGDRLRVEKLDAEQGETINLDRVLMVVDGETVNVGSPLVDTVVSASVLAHGKNKKIRVFKMKRRKNYRRTQGHRQLYTELEIIGIGGDKPAAKTAKQPASKSEKPAAEPASPASEAIVDDVLTTINGIGPVIEEKLHKLGITSFKQIAELDQEAIDRINEQLSFKGRIEREKWVEQAKDLIG